MPDITFTEVRVTDTTQAEDFDALVNMPAGSVVVIEGNSTADLADSSSEAKARARGVTITPAVANGRVKVAISGGLIFAGAGLSVKQCGVLSNNAGKIKQEPDLLSNEFVTQIYRPVTAEEVVLTFLPSNAQVP